MSTCCSSQMYKHREKLTRLQTLFQLTPKDVSLGTFILYHICDTLQCQNILFFKKVGGKYMPRKKEILPPVPSQEMEEKKVRKKSSTKEPPHQTSKPEMDKVDLQDLDATAKSAQKTSIVSRKKKQVETVDSSLESSPTSKPKKTTEPTQEAVSPETTKPKRKRRTKAEMEAARKELEIRKVEKMKDEKTDEPVKKKRRRKKEDVTAVPKEISSESVSEEVN